MSNRNQGIGIVLIVLGILVLIGRGVDLGTVLWPFFVVIPGVVLLAIAFLGNRDAAGLAVPGSIVTVIGLILFVQALTGYFESWAYAWALIPAGAGFGTFLQGALTGDHARERDGMRAVTWGLTLFAAFGAFFEFFIFDGWARGWLGRWLLPLALIVGGVALLAQRRREEPGA